jgi:hypothetical protein
VLARRRDKAKAELFELVLDAFAGGLVLRETLGQRGAFGGDGFECGMERIDELYRG